MAKYVSLGEKASIFSDPTSSLVVIGKEVVKLNAKQEISKKVKNALKGGHLINATEEEYKKSNSGKEETHTEDKFDKMTLAEMKTWVKNNSGWEDEDIKQAEAFDKPKKLAEFIRATNESYE